MLLKMQVLLTAQFFSRLKLSGKAFVKDNFQIKKTGAGPCFFTENILNYFYSKT